MTYFSSIYQECLLDIDNLIEFKATKGIKRFFGKTNYPDIYFYNTHDINKEKYLKNAKLVIVNSKRLYETLKQKHKEIKIELLYPCIKIPQDFDKGEAKKVLCEEYHLSPKTRIVSFYDLDFKNGGIKEFVSGINNLHYKGFKAFIIGDSKSIQMASLFISRLKFKEKLILVDVKDYEKVLSASDVFFAPTNKKSFNIEVLKAMSYKNVVFTTITNDISEILDNYSLMHSHNDPTVIFKMDRVLQSEDDLKLIGEQNYTKAIELSEKIKQQLALDIIKC